VRCARVRARIRALRDACVCDLYMPEKECAWAVAEPPNTELINSEPLDSEVHAVLLCVQSEDTYVPDARNHSGYDRPVQR
jgi:hypothetical protein